MPSSFIANWQPLTTPNTRLVWVLDEDDPLLDSYLAPGNDDMLFYVAGKTRRGMVGALNEAYRYFDQRGLLGFAVGFQGDDHRVRTKNWDQQYLAGLQYLQTGIVYGNDLLQGERMPTQVAFTTDIARALGYMSPPELDHLCVDLVWKAWGEHVDRLTYLPEVIVEHMHPLAGKANDDKGYKAVNSNFMAKHDSEAFWRYLDGERFQEDIGRIKMVIENGYTENRFQ